MRERVGALAEPEALTQDARNGGLQPRVGSCGAAVVPEIGVALAQVGEGLLHETALAYTRVAEDGDHLAARLGDRSCNGLRDGSALLHPADEGSPADGEVVGFADRRGALGGHAGVASFQGSTQGWSQPRTRRVFGVVFPRTLPAVGPTGGGDVQPLPWHVYPACVGIR